MEKHFHKSGKTGFNVGMRRSVWPPGNTHGTVESEGNGLMDVSCFRHCGAEKRARPKSIGPMMGT